MNRVRWVLLALLAAIVFLSTNACSPGRYVAQPNEELSGTWINEKMTNQKIAVDAGSLREFNIPSNPSPDIQGIVQITKKWTDSEGSVWYWTCDTIDNWWGLKAVPHQTLHKVSKSGTVWEQVGLWVDKFDNRNFPTKIDSSLVPRPYDPLSGYRVYYRSGK